MSSTAFIIGVLPRLQDGRDLQNFTCVCKQPRARVVSLTRSATATPVKEPAIKKNVKVSEQRETKKPENYRLYIYNDPINTRERVIDVLLKTCQGLSFSRAYAAMQEAHENGRGLVLIVYQEIAEHYCATINSAGVLSTVEPDN